MSLPRHRTKNLIAFDFVDINTPNLNQKNGTQELSLLVQLMRDIEHPDLQMTMQKYGYPENADTANPPADLWNQEALGRYLNVTLPERMRAYNDRDGQGCAFFILRNVDNNDPIALANANIRHTHLRVLNFIVDSPYRWNNQTEDPKHDYALDLMRHILHKAAELGKDEVVIVDISPYRVKSYQGMLSRLGFEEPVEAIPYPLNPSKCELHIPSRMFKSIAEQQKEVNGAGAFLHR